MPPDPASLAPSRIVLIGGDDSLARDEALDALLRAAGAEDTETESLLADSKDPRDWIVAASTAPFFSERRVTVVRSIGRVDPAKVWDEPVGKAHPGVREMMALPETSLLVLFLDDEIGDEERQRKVKSLAGSWAKIVTAAGGKTLTLNVDAAKTAELVRQRAAEMGKKITPMAARLLSEMVSGRPALAVSELEKVVLYVGDNPEIREADVKATTVPDLEYNVYKLGDAIVAGDPSQAVGQLRILFGQSSRIADQVIPRVFPTLLNQFRLIWQARFCLDKGTSPVEPDPAVAEWLPSKLLGDEPDWRQIRVVQAAKRTSLAKIQACLEALVNADAELKGQRPAVNENDSVERMTLVMCRICSSRAPAG